MIIKQRSPRALSPTQKFALALAALGLLLVFPTWAERDPQDLTGPREAQAFEREQARVREDMLELEQRAMLLEQQLREVRVQQMELEHELHRQRQEFEIRRVQEKVARSEAAGLREEAVYLGERQEELREQLELESRRADLEREVMRRALEFKRIEMEQLEAEGDPARVAELEARAARVQAELQEAHRTAREHQERLEQAMTGLAMDRLREEIHRLREAGELQQAKEVERELAHLRMSRIERMKALDAQRTLQLEIEDLQARAARLRADGLMDEAQEIERHIEALLTELGRLDGE